MFIPGGKPSNNWMSFTDVTIPTSVPATCEIACNAEVSPPCVAFLINNTSNSCYLMKAINSSLIPLDFSVLDGSIVLSYATCAYFTSTGTVASP